MIPILNTMEGVQRQEISQDELLKLHSKVLEKLGTFHFLKSGDDFDKESLQKALDYYNEAMDKARQRDMTDE